MEKLVYYQYDFEINFYKFHYVNFINDIAISYILLLNQYNFIKFSKIFKLKLHPQYYCLNNYK
jgi:hypothetical protein